MASSHPRAYTDWSRAANRRAPISWPGLAVTKQRGPDSADLNLADMSCFILVRSTFDCTCVLRPSSNLQVSYRSPWLSHGRLLLGLLDKFEDLGWHQTKTFIRNLCKQRLE